MNENVITRKERFYDFCMSEMSQWLALVVAIAHVIMLVVASIYNIDELLIESQVCLYSIISFRYISEEVIKYNKETFMKNNFLHIILANWYLTFFHLCAITSIAVVIIVRIFDYNNTSILLIIILLLIFANIWSASKISKHFKKRIQKG